MEKEKTIYVLNTLVEINNDRIKGYEKASANTEERDLKDLFSNFEQTSRKCKGDLISEINQMGGEVIEGTTTSGKFFRTWMDVKSALTGKDRKAILNSCEYGEANTIEVYNNVLDVKSEHVILQQQEMIESQLNKIKTDQSTINSMLNTLAEAK